MQKFGLIGYPLGHSLSAIIHRAGFESLGLAASYELLETSPEDLVDRVKFLKHEHYSGFNDIAGAVNTVKINPDKTFKGFNTDALGFKKAIPADIDLNGSNVALLGTGGASRAAVLALSECGVSEIGVYTRNIPNAMDYLAYMRRKFPAITFTAYQIDQVRDLSRYQMLVNTTPIGMQGRSADMTPIEEPVLKTLPEGSTVYDVIYNPKKTIMLKTAEKLGLRTVNGLDMLIYQAASAEEIWLGKTPDVKEMKIAALENL